MRTLIIASIILLLSPLSTFAQKDSIRYVDNEECGCSLTYVNGIQTTQSGRKFGFKLDDGTQIVPNKYMFVDQFTRGYCKVWMDWEQAGLIDSTGREIVPCIYDEVGFPSEGMIVVTKGFFKGYYNTQGEKVIDCKYLAASEFREGLAAVAIPIDSTEASFGYINMHDSIVLAAQYQFAQPFNEGYAVVRQYNSYGMIDKTGKVVLPIKYDKITPVIGGRMFAGYEDEIAMFDTTFRPLTKFIYQRVDHEGHGLYLVQRDGKFGFINRNGKEVIKCQYDRAGGFEEGFSWVEKNEHYGIINLKGKYLLPIKYDNNTNSIGLYSFKEGLAPICQDGKVGYIDKSGKVVIPLQYDGAKSFAEGLAPVKDKKWGFIDRHGKLVVPMMFENAESFRYGRAEIMYHSKIHYMNPNGECVKDCKGMPPTWKISQPDSE